MKRNEWEERVRECKRRLVIEEGIELRHRRKRGRWNEGRKKRRKERRRKRTNKKNKRNSEETSRIEGR